MESTFVLRKRPLALLVYALSTLNSGGQNIIDNYLQFQPVFTTIAGSAQSINQPRDLDFKPNTDELWVALKGNFSGGSHVIIYKAGLPGQSSEYRKDSHSDHFNHTTSAIAFSDIGEFATTSEIKPSVGTFMGPSLWSGDTAITARVFQNNWVSNLPLGSHLDMLHQSPFAMGIAHDTAKAYWVFDGHNGNICKYDYVAHHSPGYDNHSAGKIWRYTGVTVSRVAGVPSHLVVDQLNNWLYFVDGGSKTVKRLKTTSGSVVGNLTAPNEYLSGYYNMGSTALVETVETFTGQPCGIEHFNNRLLVSDYQTGDITVFNTAGSTVVKMGVISTGQPGIMGMKVGRDGRIWFVNYTQSTVVRADIQAANNDAEISEIIVPSSVDFDENYYSVGINTCDTTISPLVSLRNSGVNTLTAAIISVIIDGNVVQTFNWSGSLNSNASASFQLSSSTLKAGRHKIVIRSSAPNGLVDSNPANDTRAASFRIIGEVNIPYSETFAGTNFPPAGWDIVGFNKHSYITRHPSAGMYGISAGSLQMKNHTAEVENNSGQVDYAILPQIDLSSAVSDIYMDFFYAHAQYNSSANDRLRLLGSTDCGVTWSTLLDLAGPTLTTAAATTAPFVPQAFEWQMQSVQLDQFAGKKLLLKFAFVSASGNDVFVDEISVRSNNLVGVAEVGKRQIKVYPNPATEKVKIDFNTGTANTKFSISDISGRILYGTTVIGPNALVDVGMLPTGLYFITTESGTERACTKLVIER